MQNHRLLIRPLLLFTLQFELFELLFCCQVLVRIYRFIILLKNFLTLFWNKGLLKCSHIYKKLINFAFTFLENGKMCFYVDFPFSQNVTLWTAWHLGIAMHSQIISEELFFSLASYFSLSFFIYQMFATLMHKFHNDIAN